MFTSIYPEAFGIVAAEAMSSGLALVSTGVGGASEVFENEISGLSYPPGNSTALAAQLERLARDPALLNRLQQAGEAVRTQFSVKESARQLEKILQTEKKDTFQGPMIYILNYSKLDRTTIKIKYSYLKINLFETHSAP